VSYPRATAALLLLGLSLARTLATPTADEIIAKVKERSAIAEREKNSFTYQRVSRTDYLDEKGELKRSSTRVYQVAPVDGQPVPKLVEVNGRPPKHEPARSPARDAGEKTRNLALGDDLLSRFEYKLKGEDQVGGRKAWLLEFHPRHGAREDGFVDKLVNAMEGTMWVDEQEYELSKMDVHLSRKLSFFGLLGAIDKLDLTIAQKRLNSQAWLTEALTLDFSGRKLFTPIRFKCVENSKDFRKAAPIAEN
jgi:hypothetical protein